MADITLSYKGSTIATMSASGSKTIQTKEKYCEDDISLVYQRPDDILNNPDFTVNTTGLLSWDASSSGTGENSGVRAIDGWYIMNTTATQGASGLTVAPATINAFVLQEVNSYYVGKNMLLSVTVDNIEYHTTAIMTGTTSMNIDTPWGNIYVYSYGAHKFFVNVRFTDQTQHVINKVSMHVVPAE